MIVGEACAVSKGRDGIEDLARKDTYISGSAVFLFLLRMQRIKVVSSNR